jgi:hypothetical protein
VALSAPFLASLPWRTWQRRGPEAAVVAAADAPALPEANKPPLKKRGLYQNKKAQKNTKQSKGNKTLCSAQKQLKKVF